MPQSRQREEVLENIQALARAFEGHSVELRVPFVGAVQFLEGQNHRRGTPPNTIEISAELYNELLTAQVRFADVRDRVDASGARSEEALDLLEHWFNAV
ncbi:MAG: sterol carrier family protein [Candidatus Ancillula sp.]|nr:sterol carrier family protein [Candidatus Ancillula sp.]